MIASEDPDLRALLGTLDPKSRDMLRRALIRDQADRDAIASDLTRCRDERGDDWADIIDMLTMYPEEGRPVVRVLAEIEAAEQVRGRARRANGEELLLPAVRVPP